MKTTKKNNTGIKVTASVKAGGLTTANHSKMALKVRAGIKAGSTISVQNHNSRLISLA